jgi:hypothetical protein
VISNKRINVLGVASSMRKKSTSTRALKLTLDIIKTSHGAEIQILDLKQTVLPHSNQTVSQPHNNNPNNYTR